MGSKPEFVTLGWNRSGRVVDGLCPNENLPGEGTSRPNKRTSLALICFSRGVHIADSRADRAVSTTGSLVPLHVARYSRWSGDIKGRLAAKQSSLGVSLA